MIIIQNAYLLTIKQSELQFIPITFIYCRVIPKHHHDFFHYF